MKIKLLFLTLMASVLSAVPPVRADGWLQFANAPSSPSVLVYERDPVTLTLTPVPSGGAQVEFLYAPAGTTDFNLFRTVAGESPVGVLFNGRFSGGTYRLNDIEPGAVVSALVRGWTGPFASWGEAINSGTAKVGISSIFLVDTTDPVPIPPPPPANIINSVPGQGFSGLILQIPEPSSLALCGLGLSSLFAFHRRSKSNT